MLIHLGENRSVFSKDIIVILDLSNESARQALSDPEAADPSIKSCLITANERIYNTFSAHTLARRASLLTAADQKDILHVEPIVT